MPDLVINLIHILLGAFLIFTNALGDGVTKVFSGHAMEASVVGSAVSLSLPEKTAAQDSTEDELYLSLENILQTLKKEEVGSTDIASSDVTTTETANNTVAPEPEHKPEPDQPPSNEPVNLAEAIVNIYCSHIIHNEKRAISGTGFFISDNGVILTNAHVAQFLLLEHLPKYGKVNCVVRAGRDADTLYEAELLYISPTWIIDHADMINSSKPKGTGKNDFALLYITDQEDGVNQPQTFTHLPVNTDLLATAAIGETVVLVGYPRFATTGSKGTIERQVATTTVATLYTFGTKYADLIALSGSAIGAQGVSGGPVVDHTGDAIGVITTRADDEVFGTGSLKAITLSYIHRTILDETGYGLIESISGNLSQRAKIFGDIMVPILNGVLAENI